MRQWAIKTHGDKDTENSFFTGVDRYSPTTPLFHSLPLPCQVAFSAPPPVVAPWAKPGAVGKLDAESRLVASPVCSMELVGQLDTAAPPRGVQ